MKLTLEERCIFFKEHGWTYDPITGTIRSRFNILNKPDSVGYIQLKTTCAGQNIQLRGHIFGWYMVYNEIPQGEIDHINGIRTDNHIKNLRIVDRSHNNFNRKNVKGYYYHKQVKKYQAYIEFYKKRISLGFFENEEEARQAYLDAKKIYHKFGND